MKKFIVGIVLAVAVTANAGLWEGLSDENHVFGPKIVERDILCKAVLVYYLSDSEAGVLSMNRVEALWKSYDHKRFYVIGVCVGDKDKAVAELTKHKVTFPVYKDFKLKSDTGKRPAGNVIIVSQFGKLLVGTGTHGAFNKDHEQMLVEAISEVGLPPNVMPGVSLDKYKALKNKIKLGVNLKGVIKSLEKDVAAAEKKTANAAQKAKAEEASSILSAIKDGKAEISENINAMTEVNPEEAYKLLSLYVKSFPEEAADNKEKLAELKVKAAEFKKQK